MKIIFIIGFLGLLCLGFSQISTIKVAPIVEPINYAPYDSTRNFLGKDVGQYVGQVLYLKGKSEALRKYGYEGFVVDYRIDDLINYSNVYKGNKVECRYNSDYNELAGKYFSVIAVLKHPKTLSDSYLYSDYYYLELEEQRSKDKLFFKYNSKYEWSFPFVVVGFFEKQKTELVGERFIFCNKLIDDVYDIYTGSKITKVPYQEWTCTDFTIEERYFSLGLVVKNSLGESIHVSVGSVTNSNLSSRSGYNVKEFRHYSKKFGDDNWKSIVEGIVRVGFTEEMVKMAWGEPKSINHSSYGDQWVYESQYLYFEGGILRSFN